MQKLYKLFPLENEESYDVYDDIQGDYCDQFNLPFLRECADFIDTQMKEFPVNVRVVVSDETRNLFEITTSPTRENYFGTKDDEFNDLLWRYHNIPITILVDISPLIPVN